MKQIRILTLIAIFGISLVCFSCEKDDAGNFDKSATERLQERIDEVYNLLQSNTNGWVMKYYIGSSQSGGGYIYTLKFNETEAEVGFELSESIFGKELGETITSLYKITDDSGPVLSFDTYNEYLHYFSTPSSGNYQAMGGDFEFEIFDVQSDKITMIGRRSRNLIVMEPLTQSSEEYLSGVANISKNFIPYYLNGTVGSKTITGTVDYGTRHISLKVDDKEYTTAFCFTPDGLSLYVPVEMGGVEVKDIKYDLQSMKLSTTSLDITGSVPDGWLPFDEYEGNYRLDYTGQFYANVTLTPGQYNSTYILSGLNRNYNLVLNYNMQTGRLELKSQMIGTVDGYSIYFCAWALDDGGSVTWAPEAGMQLVWNKDSENPVYTFEANSYTWRNASGGKCATDSFILFAVGTTDVFYYDKAAWGTNGYAQWPYLESLTKL